MGGIQIDFSEVEGFEALPEGTYDCIIEKVEVRESNSSDNNYLNWELRVTDDENEDRRIFLGTSFSPKALIGVKDSFVMLGVCDEDDTVDIQWEDDVDITPREGPQVIEPELAGLACTVETKNSVYNNRERQDAWNSSIVSGPDGGGAKKASPAKKTGGSKPAAKKASGGRRKLR